MRKFFLFLISLLSLILSIFPGKASVTAEVKVEHGRPLLYINGKETAPFAYMSYFGEVRYYREVAAAGIHLYSFPAYLGDRGINSASGIGPFRPSLWPEPGRYDYSSIEMDFRKLLEADPQAMAIIRIHLDPPGWWDRKHPTQCSLQPDGGSLRQSFSSDLWREDAGAALGRLVSWLLDSEFRDHLAGIHLAAGFTEEWFYHFKERFYDQSPARKKAFQQWLQLTYRDSPAHLKSAWNSDEVTFATAVPSDISGSFRAERWRNEATERPVLDTFRFHASTMAENIAYFCRIVKSTSNNRLLTGAFYGYHYYVTDPRRGHGALEQLLDCPDLDYLSSPNVYTRVPGEDWPPMTAVQSVMKKGKLWLAENDTRTSLTTLLKKTKPEICPPGQYEGSVWLGPPDIETSTALLQANAARMLCYGYGGWWFDMWGGWFSHPAFLNIIKSTLDLHRTSRNADRVPLETQVCVVTDEEMHFFDAGYGTLAGEILANRSALGKTGAPYDLFLRSDLADIKSASYKVIWLLGILDLTPDEKALILERTRQGTTMLWTNEKGTFLRIPARPRTFFPGRFLWNETELSHIWEKAGVHLYVRTGDVIYAGNGLIGLHTNKGGSIDISLPFAARVTDALTGQPLADESDSIEIQLPPGSSTRLFCIAPSPARN